MSLLCKKNYLDKCYNETINIIQKHVKNKRIWVNIDETSYIEYHYVTNIIIGILETSKPKKYFLLNCRLLEKANTKLSDRSMGIIWLNGVKHNNVLLFASNLALHIIKGSKYRKPLYSKMERVTCLLHGLQRVAEEVSEHFPKVDALISNIKKIIC